MRTRIKICGLRDLPGVDAAVQSGADAIGLVFYPASARQLAPEQARELAAALPAFVASVALFLDADATTVRDIVDRVRPDLIQFHGNETPEFCRSFKRPYLKAVPMGADMELEQWFRDYADASALLLDSHAPGKAGGSGESFDWSRALPSGGPPVILAGGLHPDNVGEAICTVRPYAVDVSSGVESAPGIKDKAKIKAFTDAVRRADCE